MDNSDMVRMANQIAGFFKSYGAEEGTKEVAAHINAFWEPRMRVAFFKHVAAGGQGLDPMVLAAAKLVRHPVEGTKDLKEIKDRKTGLPKEAHEA